jgi:ribbon-helix-helix protein
MSHMARHLSVGEKQRSYPVRDDLEAIERLGQESESDVPVERDSERALNPMKMDAAATSPAQYSPGYKTKTRQKYSLYIDDRDLKKLKAYEKDVGVPVSESIRRAISFYLKNFQK